MVLLMTLRRASTMAPRVAWKPKATLSGRLEGLLQAPAEKDDPAAAERLAQWLSDKRNVVVLTGVGLSTDSGIPDYRGKAGSYRLGHVPIGHDEFMRNESSRRRYWARALVGCGPVWKSNFRRSTPSTRVPINSLVDVHTGIRPLLLLSRTTRISPLLSSRRLASCTRSSRRTSTVFTKPLARGT